MQNHDQPKCSDHGFTLNKFAYGLDAASLLLMLLYPFADTHFDKKKIMGVAFALTIVVLLVCLLTSRSVRNRWLPFLLAVILLMIHGLFVPHL